MKLYHTGTLEIPQPDIRHGRVNADFGQGFYMTPDADFTYRWAGKDAVVNVYEMDLSGLEVHRFTRTGEWFEYIYNNRRAKDTLNVDVVIGPIANDTIFETYGIISSGFLNTEDALRLLMIGPEYTQVAIKTERAVRQLKWLEASVVEGVAAHREALRNEKTEYDRRFAEALNQIMGDNDEGESLPSGGNIISGE